MSTQTERVSNSLAFTFKAGSTDSNTHDLHLGCFGTILVPAESEADGADVQFVAVPQPGHPDPHPTVELLITAKTIVAGANPLTSDEVTAVGAASLVKLRLSAAVIADTKIWLLWKS